MPAECVLEEQMKESDILKACQELLTAERIPWYRMNSGKIILRNGNGTRRAIKLNPEGTPDLLFHLHGIDMKDSLGAVMETWFKVIWIETKALEKRPTPEQQRFGIAAAERGEIWMWVNDVKQLQDWLKEMRK